ncbi:unnamed protein product, partial [Iphiclides podalirius]
MFVKQRTGRSLRESVRGRRTAADAIDSVALGQATLSQRSFAEALHGARAGGAEEAALGQGRPAAATAARCRKLPSDILRIIALTLSRARTPRDANSMPCTDEFIPL